METRVSVIVLLTAFLSQMFAEENKPVFEEWAKENNMVVSTTQNVVLFDHYGIPADIIIHKEYLYKGRKIRCL
ncbi:MAG: hypothetical protein A2452_04545 [Candidatus Firestonebacteria bacterium RIFOXYC2_FULL_39_67]|nr:MAG: hypothetical protein A2536_11515 [Candidatus Firestonebacteria bacterium RIFOXYD2_FULL_39_29]OGF55857.1 MAG: hypothetical protein A2452_04545 [Candidatus Firestonebacteria bacterium RIFOXYC2_FULL_39_67]